jgi:hypothetical protein
MRCPDCRGELADETTPEGRIWVCVGGAPSEIENDARGSCGLNLTQPEIEELDPLLYRWVTEQDDTHPADREDIDWPPHPVRGMNFPFNDPHGIRKENVDTTEPCLLCERVGGHTEGCPNGDETQIFCGACQIPIRLSQMAAHMNDVHDADLDQDEIERQYQHVRDIMRDTIPEGGFGIPPAVHPPGTRVTSRAQAERLTGGDPPSLFEIWGALGYHCITGDWPPDFDLGEALQVAMTHFIDAANGMNDYADRLNQMAQADSHNPLLDHDYPETDNNEDADDDD